MTTGTEDDSDGGRTAIAQLMAEVSEDVRKIVDDVIRLERNKLHMKNPPNLPVEIQTIVRKHVR